MLLGQNDCLTGDTCVWRWWAQPGHLLKRLDQLTPSGCTAGSLEGPHVGPPAVEPPTLGLGGRLSSEKDKTYRPSMEGEAQQTGRRPVHGLPSQEATAHSP